MKDKVGSLPVGNVEFSNTDLSDEQLKKVKIKVCKEGLVPDRKMIITRNAIEKAIEKSIFNKPLLCAYEYNSNGEAIDFKGHEKEYELVKNGVKYDIEIKYIEQPVGIIPESCNPRFETFEDGEWLVIDAYLYSIYCEEAVSIFESSDSEKSVSMEIKFLDVSEDKDGNAVINDFVFKGITLLGDKYEPAIANASMTEFSYDKFAEEFQKLVQRVNKIEKEGGDRVNRDEIIAKYEHLKAKEQFQVIVDNKDLSIEDLEKELFSLSVNDLEDKIREELSKATYTYVYSWGEGCVEQKYYIRDVLVSENIVIVRDCESYIILGVPYSISGDAVTLDYANAKRYIRGDWRPYVDGDIVEDYQFLTSKIEKMNEKIAEQKNEFEKVQNDLDETKASFTTIQTEKSDLEGQVKELAEFKADFEKKQKEEVVNEIFEEFAQLSNIEGFKEIKDGCFEMETEDLITKLKVLAYDSGIILNKKSNFSKQPNVIKTNINHHEAELSEAEKRYGVGIKKYKK